MNTKWQFAVETLTCRPRRLLVMLQIENLLISNQGTIKLCDFGSSTTVSHYPDYSWSAQKRSMVEDEVHTHTDLDTT